jgi:hypothetical protein
VVCVAEVFTVRVHAEGVSSHNSLSALEFERFVESRTIVVKVLSVSFFVITFTSVSYKSFAV